METTTTASTVTTHLTGDWTITGVAQQVPKLTQPDITGAGPGGTVVIDCSGIHGIDLSGFQLLYVWLQCIQLRGLCPEVVNVSGCMREAELRLGIKQLFESEPGVQKKSMPGKRRTHIHPGAARYSN